MLLWISSKRRTEIQLQGFYVPCTLKIQSNLPSSYPVKFHPLVALVCPRTFSVYPSPMLDFPASFLSNWCDYFCFGKYNNVSYVLHNSL